MRRHARKIDARIHRRDIVDRVQQHGREERAADIDGKAEHHRAEEIQRQAQKIHVRKGKEQRGADNGSARAARFKGAEDHAAEQKFLTHGGQDADDKQRCRRACRAGSSRRTFAVQSDALADQRQNGAAEQQTAQEEHKCPHALDARGGKAQPPRVERAVSKQIEHGRQHTAYGLRHAEHRQPPCGGQIRPGAHHAVDQRQKRAGCGSKRSGGIRLQFHSLVSFARGGAYLPSSGET